MPVTESSPARIEGRRLRNVVILTVLAALGLLVARYADIELFAPVEFAGRVMLASLAVLAGVLILAELLLQSQPFEERKKLWERQVIPEGNTARIVWLVTWTIAGITEEIIFRGVLFGLLTALTGNIAIAALVSAILFALAHFRQGWKSMVFIAAIALLFQWLVIHAGSLVPAMVVHVVYNVARGLRATNAMRELEEATHPRGA